MFNITFSAICLQKIKFCLLLSYLHRKIQKMIKYLFLTLLLGALPFTGFTTVRTVCNMPYSPGQYTTFNAALTASAVNDTIYVHGSSINYGAITINKSGITVIGTGHNPNKQVPLTSNFTTITLSHTNIKVIGIICEAILTQFASGYPTGATIKRCKITGNATYGGIANLAASNSMENWLIEGNVFSTLTLIPISISGGTTTNTTIRNNVFCTSSYSIYNNSLSTTAFTFTIANNLFLGSSINTFSSLAQAMINNNIFYRSSPQGMMSGCTMNNNISFSCPNNNFAVTGANNLVNVNPMFTNFPLAGAVFDYSHNYTLTATSPGLATGTDGSDRGVYGGFGYKFNMTGEPAMPEILTFAITSPTVISPGGTLTISVKSKRIR
jgi:hypothetical protein